MELLIKLSKQNIEHLSITKPNIYVYVRFNSVVIIDDTIERYFNKYELKQGLQYSYVTALYIHTNDLHYLN